MRQRFVQFSRSAIELFQKFGSWRMATARRFRRDVRLRFSGLAMPYFHCFAAHGGMRFHPALQFDRRTIPYHSIELCCALQQFRPPHVRFTPKSGYWNSAVECPLCAKSRHSDGSWLLLLVRPMAGSNTPSRSFRNPVNPISTWIFRGEHFYIWLLGLSLIHISEPTRPY